MGLKMLRQSERREREEDKRERNERGAKILSSFFFFIIYFPHPVTHSICTFHQVTYFEIYMEKIRDLLCDGNDNLQIHENRERGVYVRHATELFMQARAWDDRRRLGLVHFCHMI